MPDSGDTPVAAAAIFEIVLIDTARPRRWWSWFSRQPSALGGAIVSVRRIRDGREVFRHVEDLGDDEDHLLDGLRSDLGSMTAAEFKAAWA